MAQGDGHGDWLILDDEERQRIERSNQIFLRLRKELHDREKEPAERDVGEAVQAARWLREIVERHSDGLEQAFEEALSESELPDEDQSYLREDTEEMGGFSSFVGDRLRRLEEAAPAEGEHDPAAGISHRDLMCGVVAGLLTGGTLMGNFFYFGFAVGASRKAGC